MSDGTDSSLPLRRAVSLTTCRLLKVLTLVQKPGCTITAGPEASCPQDIVQCGALSS